MKKKLLVILLIASLIITVFSGTVIADNLITGDLNGDGKISSSDALMALQFAVSKIILNPYQKDAADTNADGTVSSSDALQILQYSVEKISSFTAGATMEERYYARLDKNYGVDGSDFIDYDKINDWTDAGEVIDSLGTLSDSSDVDGYDVVNGKLVYNPISAEAEKTGTLNKYSKTEKTTGTLNLNDITVNYSLPKDVTAYDVIPIQYSAYVNGSARLPLHIEANTFEEPDRYEEGVSGYYDATLPGNAKVNVEYLGYVTGTEESENRPYHSGDFSSDVISSSYPSYTTDTLTYSDDIPRKDLCWFKFRFTNTGDTILDSEGAGYFVFHTYLYKQNSSGEWNQVCSADNLRNPLFDYLYPGESGEMWINFGDYYKPFAEGNFKIEIEARLRCHNSNTTSTDDGICINKSTLNFKVSRYGSDSVPADMTNEFLSYAPRNQWLAKYEEFMNSYDSIFDLSRDSSSPTTGTIYVQAADFSKAVTLKIMCSSLREMSSVTIPINVETDSVNINLNPLNDNYYVKEDGTRTPLIATQTMADMRVNTAMGPYTESLMLNQILDMKEAGINYIQTTLAGNFNVGSQTGNNSRYHGDILNYALSIVRSLGLKIEGVMSYPYNNADLFNLAKRITGQTFTVNTAYSSTTLETVNAIFANWSYKRWGDMYYSLNDSTIPIATEDTRAWLDHYNTFVYPISNQTVAAFDAWLQAKYKTISAYNTKYKTTYTSFDEINPLLDNTRSDIYYDFNNSSAKFHVWNDAYLEFCLYRTVERAQNYTNILAQTTDIPNAKINMRLEGTQWMVAGIDPDTTNPYYRRIYYAQIQNAAVPEIMYSSDTVAISSGYSNNNLSPSMIYELSKESTKQGITNLQLATLNRMRDYAYNSEIGKNAGDIINSESNAYIAFIDTRPSLFTWFKAAYEGGSIPGVLWQDYTCDGVMTVSQYKELLFFKSKIDEMLATEAGHEWATNFTDTQTTSAEGYWSYSEDYIKDVIANTERNSQFNTPYKRLAD